MTRYNEEQIAFALKRAETGTQVEEICRKMVISETILYIWKKKFDEMGVTELRRLRQFEDQHKIEQFREAYNYFPPHSSLNNLTLAEFVQIKPTSAIKSPPSGLE